MTKLKMGRVNQVAERLLLSAGLLLVGISLADVGHRTTTTSIGAALIAASLLVYGATQAVAMAQRWRSTHSASAHQERREG